MTVDAAQTSALMLSTTAAGGTAAAVTLVGGAEPRLHGNRMVRLRSPEGERTGERTVGGLGSDRLDAEAIRLLDEAIGDTRSRDGLRTVDTDGGEAELYLEVRRALRDLIIVGAGHIAQPMCHLGALLGYRVTVLDDRPDFATQERFPDADRLVRADFSDPFAEVPIGERSHLLLVTRGHKYDYECLIRALRTDPPPAYIGMIGSRRRVRATYVQLLDEGIEPDLIGRIHAPVGLDIGAETPEEIAVAVAAELVMQDRGGSGASLTDVERIPERFFAHRGKDQSTTDAEDPE
jgi:xanthine dehydrogenase accessory factor